MKDCPLVGLSLFPRSKQSRNSAYIFPSVQQGVLKNNDACTNYFHKHEHVYEKLCPKSPVDSKVTWVSSNSFKNILWGHVKNWWQNYPETNMYIDDTGTSLKALKLHCTSAFYTTENHHGVTCTRYWQPRRERCSGNIVGHAELVPHQQTQWGIKFVRGWPNIFPLPSGIACSGPAVLKGPWSLVIVSRISKNGEIIKACQGTWILFFPHKTSNIFKAFYKQTSFIYSIWQRLKVSSSFDSWEALRFVAVP